MAERGELPLVPNYHSRVRDLMHAHNNRPNSALPRIVDTTTGEQRHMSPNEYAASLPDQAVQLLAPQMMPRFVCKGVRAKVTRNGVRVNRLTYGRFEPDLHALREVTVYVADACPEAAYIAELGRFVSATEKVAPGDYSQMDRKRAVEASIRTKRAEAAIQLLEKGLLPQREIYVLPDPVPNRATTTVVPEALIEVSQGMARGIAEQRAAEAELRDRTSFGSDYRQRKASSQPSGRRTGLKAATTRLAKSNVYAGSSTEDAPCN
jgi:hypothetical protein